MIIFDRVTKEYSTPRGVRTILDDVSFTLPKSCKLGILGMNGAGKSTLVQLISGAQMPTSGTVTRVGRLSWPLGFGGGFNGSLSGLENCLFVSRIYGRNEREIAAFVADFSELGDHFYLPVRGYSSGMRARLSFALSLAFDFDYYLIDEVIAVGDARFRAKCQAALQDIHSRAGVILVSHSRDILEEHCTEVALVDNKKITFYDNLKTGWKAYGEVVQAARAKSGSGKRGAAAGMPDAQIDISIVGTDAAHFN